MCEGLNIIWHSLTLGVYTLQLRKNNWTLSLEETGFVQKIIIIIFTRFIWIINENM